MDKAFKDWGNGIPDYSEDDVLRGLELHEFCANIVAQSMQNDGYTIEGIVINHSPTQVIANKDGKRYYVIVAGDIFPNEGKIAFSLKKKYAVFCKRQNVIPMFASVGLMSIDPVRAMKGLALKYDGYRNKFKGLTDLSEVPVPSRDSSEYQDYCIEKIIEAYSTGNFDILYDMFDESIHSFRMGVKPINRKTKSD